MLPTEQVPALDRSRYADTPSGPVELPEIISATDTARHPPERRQAENRSTSEAAPPADSRTGRHANDAGTESFDGDDPTDSWVETPVPPVAVEIPGGGLQMRPVGRRPRVRKVTRVLRHVDPWSAFKVGLMFSVVLYVVLLTAGVLLWNVAANTGTLANIERWFTQFGWETFELNGSEIFRNAWVGGLFAAVGLTGFIVLVATMFNLVSDMVGGIRVTVLEEEVVERSALPSKRFVVRRTPTPETTWSVDRPPHGSATPGQTGNGASSTRSATSPVVRSTRAVEETTN